MRPDKKLHTYSSWCAAQRPPNYIACAYSSEFFSRQQQGERGRKKGGRAQEREPGKGEEKRKWDRQAQLDHLGCLLVGGVTTGSSLSAIWSATLYPPTRCLRMSHRVRLAALVGSFTAVSKSRCVRIANGRLVSPPAGHMLPHAALFPGHLHMHRPGSSHPAPGVRTGRLGVLSSLFSSGRGSFPLFEVRHAALDVLLPVVRLPVPQHGLDAWPLIGQPLSATVPSTLSQWLSVSFFGLRLRGRWLATVLPSRLSRWCAFAAWCNGAGGFGVSLLWLATVSDELCHARLLDSPFKLCNSTVQIQVQWWNESFRL